MVRSAEELMLAFERTQAEAGSTFGDPVVFMESLVGGGRHGPGRHLSVVDAPALIRR